MIYCDVSSSVDNLCLWTCTPKCVDCFGDADVETLSTCSDSSSSSDGAASDSDSDFFVVPIPDFFNPDLPASRTASTKVIINKGQTSCHPVSSQ